jgi:hypothetical protein
MMILRLTLLVFFSITSTFCYSQSDSTNKELNKNNVFATLGFIPLYGVLNGNYERRVWKNKSKLIQTGYIRGSGGAWASWLSGGPQYGVGMTSLSGSKNSHLEMHLGVSMLVDSYYEEEDGELAPPPSRYLLPAAGVGYRYQKPGGHFLFRAGLAIPESLYISLGVSF